MIDAEILSMVRDARDHAQSLGITPNPVLSTQSAVQRLGVDLLLRYVIRTQGCNLPMMHAAADSREPSHELIARRIPMLAAECEEFVVVTIVDDGRLHWRGHSMDPSHPLGRAAHTPTRGQCVVTLRAC